MNPTNKPRLKQRRGIALIVVLLVTVAVTSIAAGAAFLGLNTQLIGKYHSRLSLLETVADAGLEQARSAINGNKAIYPDTGYIVFEDSVTVSDASGTVIPGVRRSTYIGPTGITSGQYGVFGSVVVVTTDDNNNRVVRRGEVVQESFAKYAYFTDIEGSIVFGANDVLYGPIHSNDDIQIQAANPGATFWGLLKTAEQITNRSWGNYNAGYEENAPEIPFPETAELTKLETQASLGGTDFTSSTAGTQGQASMRIEFVALDLNADGDSTDSDEGFMKIYQVADPANSWFVVATAVSHSSYGVARSANCGHILATGSGTKHSYFMTFANHSGSSSSSASRDYRGYAVDHGTHRTCHLGGSDILNADTDSLLGRFVATDAYGSWQAWTGTVDSRVTAVRPGDDDYLWPLSRSLNPNFKGVIYVDGKVAISGKLRGSITVAASGNIIIADNIVYVTNPGGTTPCNSPERDMLGLFSGEDVIVANNLLNTPWREFAGSGSYRTWADRSGDEYIHAVVLAISNFTAEDFDLGNTNIEDCSGADDERGCLYLTGGIIQYTRGPVGQTNGRGYIKRYQYDPCAGLNPPPYFPTTGHFVRGHYYEVDPASFDIATYWPLLVPATP